jgi:hypothetical protein
MLVYYHYGRFSVKEDIDQRVGKKIEYSEKAINYLKVVSTSIAFAFGVHFAASSGVDDFPKFNVIDILLPMVIFSTLAVKLTVDKHNRGIYIYKSNH